MFLYIYGNYLINKNNFYLSTINEKINVKIIGPNFDLKYGIEPKEIQERFNKLIKYSDPDKNKKTVFDQRKSEINKALLNL